MSDDIIGSDAPLDRDQRAMVDVLLDMIIPPSADGQRPGAATFDVVGYVLARDGGQHEGQIDTIRRDLSHLQSKAKARHDISFDELDPTQQWDLVETLRKEDPDFLRPLALGATLCYYEQFEVLEAIGLPPRTPYPEGFDVESGDLNLLDPVRTRGKLYRDT